MELVVAQVVAVLGKYALDKGEGLLREAGKATADAARDLFDTVIARLKDDPATTVIAEGFEKKPDSYAQPVEDVLTEKVQADPELESRLIELMGRLKAATPPATYSILVSGSGAVAVDHSIAVGEHGTVATDGSVVVSGGTLSGGVGRPREEEPP